MNNQEFDELVKRTIQESSGKQLPLNHKGANYDSFFTEEDKQKRELLKGLYSTIFESGTSINWGVELVSPIPSKIVTVTPDYFFDNSKKRAFLFFKSLSCPYNDTFKLFSDDLETVTAVPINEPAEYRHKKEFKMPNVQDKGLELATTLIFQRFYR